MRFTPSRLKPSLSRSPKLIGKLMCVVAACSIAPAALGQNTLAAGDIAIIGMDTAGATVDSFVFVNLVDLPSGTVIYFTDNGWNPALVPPGFRGVLATDGDGNENLQQFVSTALIPAGTIINSSLPGSGYVWTTGTVAGTTQVYTVPSLSQGGEQIYAFESSDPTDNPLFTGGTTPATLNHLFVLDDTNGFENGTNTNTGNVPAGLTAGVNALTFSFSNPVKFFNTSTLISGTKADWLNAIANAANWSSLTSGTLPVGTINVAAPTVPSITGISFTGGPGLSGGQSVGFTVTLSGPPVTSPALVEIASPAFVAPITVSISAPASSGSANATLAGISGSPLSFTATASATTNATGGATSSVFTVYPAASASISPSVSAALAGGSRTITATVLAGQGPAVGVSVNFQITSGPNAPFAASAVTSGSGQASVSYTSNGQIGVDSITASGSVSGNPFTAAATQSWASAGPFYLSELLTNSPGTDQDSESIELQGPSGTSLAGYSILIIEGDAGNAGTLDKVIQLDSLSVGTSGLLLLRDSSAVLDPAPDAQTTVFVADFDPDIENDGNTYVLGYGPLPSVNTDLDLNNDGSIDAGALAGFTAVDAIGYFNGDNGGFLYGDDFGTIGQNLPQPAPSNPDTDWTPDQITRILTPSGSPCGWAASDVFGSFPGPYTFALNEQLGFIETGYMSIGALQMSLGSGNPRSPAVTTAPVPVTVNAGDSATLSVSAIATGYQWRRNGADLADGGVISGAQSASLTINPAGAANGGSYDVVLTSPCGTLTTSAVALTVNGGGCTADFNLDQAVTADDIFAFLDAWFVQNGQTGVGLSADFNGDESVTADDIFAFLDAWFAQNGTCN